MNFSKNTLKKISLVASSAAIFTICLFAYTIITAPKDIGVSNQAQENTSINKKSAIKDNLVDQPLADISQTPQENTPMPTPQPEKDSEKVLGSQLKSDFSDGTYLIGIDIAPGTYETSDPTPTCLYETLSGTDTSTGKVNIRANGKSESRVKVTISNSATAFMTTGCGNWKKIN